VAVLSSAAAEKRRRDLVEISISSAAAEKRRRDLVEISSRSRREQG
jgi:hypothetical protein